MPKIVSQQTTISADVGFCIPCPHPSLIQ